MKMLKQNVLYIQLTFTEIDKKQNNNRHYKRKHIEKKKR